MPGRPTVAATLAGAGGSVASAVLVAQGGAVAPVGCAAGFSGDRTDAAARSSFSFEALLP